MSLASDFAIPWLTHLRDGPVGGSRGFGRIAADVPCVCRTAAKCSRSRPGRTSRLRDSVTFPAGDKTPYPTARWAAAEGHGIFRHDAHGTL